MLRVATSKFVELKTATKTSSQFSVPSVQMTGAIMQISSTEWAQSGARTVLGGESFATERARRQSGHVRKVGNDLRA